MNASSTQHWFAVQTKARFEKVAHQVLLSKGYDAFLPLYSSRRQWNRRAAVVEVPLFSGYLFCRMDPAKRLPVLTTPGVIRILSSGKTLLPVPESEVQSVRNLLETGLQPEPWPFAIGDKVEIPAGPLRGICGTVVQKDGKHRLVVSITLLQRSVSVTIETDWLTSRSPSDERNGYMESVRRAGERLAL